MTSQYMGVCEGVWGGAQNVDQNCRQGRYSPHRVCCCIARVVTELVNVRGDGVLYVTVLGCARIC